MDNKLLIESHYFPSIVYIKELMNYSLVEIESCENYQKQTYRNRCYILNPNGPLMLSVPVQSTTIKCIKDIKIDYSQRWEQNHIRAIQSAYGKAAFFEFYFEDFRKIIMSKCPFLFDLNFEIMSKCLDQLKKEIIFSFSEEYLENHDYNYTDKRNVYNEAAFKPEKQDFRKYYQLFGSKFVANVSIIDLLFNEGTNAKQILYSI